MRKALLGLIIGLASAGGCSKDTGPAAPTTAPTVQVALAYTPTPDPTALEGQAEFAQFRKEFYPLWLRLKKAIEEGSGNSEFEDLQRRFGSIKPGLKDPAKQAAATEFVRDCGFRCITSTSQRTLYAVKATTGSIREAQQEEQNNKIQALDFIRQYEEKWKALEKGQLVPVSDSPELKIGQRIYQPDGGYVGMVKESKVDKGEMQWVVSAPDGSDQMKPLQGWQSSGFLLSEP